MAAVMIKLNTRARALATTAPLALVLGLRGGGDICPWTALGNMSRGLDPQDAVAPTATGGGFEFSVGEARFRYDKLGLRRV